MKRATITTNRDEPGSVAACEAWMQRWKPQLIRISENYGCGCCVDIYDVEGADEAIDAIPEELRTSSEWAVSGRGFGGVPRTGHRPWWRFW
jgi:hypothetical protein